MTDTCQYIGSYGLKPTCCAPTLGKGFSYCAEHYSLVYAKGTSAGRRLKDARRAEALRQLVSDFNAAIEELEQEGFDVYGDSEREITVPAEDSEDWEV
jgi:hypothetical protein